MLKNYTGFSLLELLLVISILGVLCSIVYPNYNNYFVAMHRNNVEMNILDIAIKLEQYYSYNNTYVGATLDKLAVNTESYKDFYIVELNKLTDTEFIIQAQPIANQEQHDKSCGILTIDQNGNKTISGNSDVKSCWR